MVIAAAVAFTSSVFAQSSPSAADAKPADKQAQTAPVKHADKKAVTGTTAATHPVKKSSKKSKKHSEKKAAAPAEQK